MSAARPEPPHPLVRLRRTAIVTDPDFARWYGDYVHELDVFASEPTDLALSLAAWADDPDAEVSWIETVDDSTQSGTTVGFCIVRVLPDWPQADRSIGEIAEFMIAGDARRRGLGRAAVEALLGELRDRGVTEVEAAILTGNEAAVTFWARLGFRPHSVTTTRNT